MYTVKDAKREMQEALKNSNDVSHSFIMNIWKSKDITREEALELEREYLSSPIGLTRKP